MRTFDKHAVPLSFGKVLLCCALGLAMAMPVAQARPHPHASPVIEQITPPSYDFGIPHAASGSYETVVTLTILGTGFQKHALALFNGRRVPTAYASDARIVATVPGDWLRAIPNKLISPDVPADGMQGYAKIQVRNPGHRGMSQPFLFPITAIPIE